ncbi:ABC transporter permease subunit [Conexibacter woesei]|uniref:Uncharacterized protein n=1 Tax=Conexibacter woesei (strain DSM 14684 / CCUG 47730 / CIP 108061 / JCM 11494 / NBRC 100937 / ID131577) TaxID=469383 RepID=D3F1N2_CONWI|nr:ABC transporter permease subunit [Conexibacter woesei]ADB54063.1 hypothetical protein Cwoe_5659 [Conexibacter woesei DSM 14684]
MSAVTAPEPAGFGTAAPRTGADVRPGLARLTKVELRKMTDTRAGFWLLVTVALLTLAIVAIVCISGDAADHTFDNMLEVALAPSSVLLPIVGILVVTSEWTQRTSLITFALVPQRERVLAGKLLAGAVLALLALVVALIAAAIGTLVMSPDVDDVWSLQLGLLGQDVIAMVTGMFTGVAFGAMLLATAPAIVLYFALPIAFGAIGSISALNDVAEWVDASRALAPMTSELLSGTQWARALVALAVWVALPLAIGLWRFLRGEVR